MKRLLFTLIPLLTALILSLGMTSAAWAWDRPTWKIVPNPNPDNSVNSSLSGVAAVSSNDVWAVGSTADPRTETFNALIEHWNGARWQIVASPNASQNSLHAVAADGAHDAWAVGGNAQGGTLTEHWNGHRWSITPSPNPVSSLGSTLSGVTALSPTNAWVVGSYLSSSTQRTLIEHWNGHQWNIVPSPNGPSGGNQLGGVVAISTNDVWAVGITNFLTSDAKTLVEHWNGHTWSIVPSPNGSQFGSRLFGVAALSATNIWAVGNYSPEGGETPPSNTLVEHWNGAKWSIVPSPNVAGAFASFLNGVAIVSGKDIWAVGSSITTRTMALIEHWNGHQWSIVPSPTGTTESTLHAVTHVPGTRTAWAVGDVFTSGRFTLTMFHG